MDFNKIKEGAYKNAKNYGEKYNIEIDEEFVTLKFFEEMGEFSEALLTYKKRAGLKNTALKKKQKKNWAKNLPM